MSSSGDDLLPNIGELPIPVQDRLRKFARIAKTAVDERNDARRQLKGLQNLTQILQECQARNESNQNQFKWFEIVLLRTEADLVRTKTRLRAKEDENRSLRRGIAPEEVGGSPSGADGRSVVRDFSDGKSHGCEESEGMMDETDHKKQPVDQSAPKAGRPQRPVQLSPTFQSFPVGVSKELYDKMFQQLEETRKELIDKIEQDDVTYKQYLDARKCELQINKQQDALKEKDALIAKQLQTLDEIQMEDNEKVITDLKSENKKLMDDAAIQLTVIEAANCRCQELKWELSEAKQTYKRIEDGRRASHQSGGRAELFQREDLSTDSQPSSMQRIIKSNDEMKRYIEELELNNEKLTMERDEIGRQYENCRQSLEIESRQSGSVSAKNQERCKMCSNHVQQIKRLQSMIPILEGEKSATLAQMNLFEDDFHKTREELKFSNEKHEKEVSNLMQNCQALSQNLDRVNEENQKVKDYNQALEYQLSIVSEYMTEQQAKPYYSMDHGPAARSDPDRRVHHPAASPWQEGYRRPQAVQDARDYSDGTGAIQTDSATYDELKGAESEEEAELTRR